jgi:hypothetical protein
VVAFMSRLGESGGGMSRMINKLDNPSHRGDI